MRMSHCDHQDLDDEGQVTLGSSPTHAHQDHWVQAFTAVEECGHWLGEGGTVLLRAMHDDTSIWFEVAGTEKAPGGAVAGGAGEVAAGPCVSPAPPMPKGDRPALFELLDAERLAVLNDAARNAALARRVRSAVARAAGGGGLVVHLGDGPLLPLLLAHTVADIAADSATDSAADGTVANGGPVADDDAMRPGGHVRIVSFASDEASLELSARFLGANRLLSWVHVTTCEPGLELPPRSVSLVTAEPYFQPEHYARQWGGSALLRYWLSCHALTPYLADGAVFAPSVARLMGAVVECGALWRARQPCGAAVEGLDLCELNSLHSYARVEAVPIWRHAHKLLTRPAELLRLAFNTPPNRPAESEVSLLSLASGTGHALLLWLEYHEGEDGPMWATTAPDEHGCSPHLQGIRYFATPRVAREGDAWVCRASVNAPEGLLTAGVTWMK